MQDSAYVPRPTWESRVRGPAAVQALAMVDSFIYVSRFQWYFFLYSSSFVFVSLYLLSVKIQSVYGRCVYLDVF